MKSAKNVILLSLTVLLFLAWDFFIQPKSFKEQPNTFFQVSTIDALFAGKYDGIISFDELLEHGNFGHGTFDGLDGELVCFDAKCHQIKYDGSVKKVEPGMTSPFANLVSFKPDQAIKKKNLANFNELKTFIDSHLDKNSFYAIKIKAGFQKLKTRSVAKQSKPYPGLKEVLENQSIFNLENISGTMVGFWLPDYFRGINVPGHHYHFLSGDRNSGGHVLDFNQATNISIEIDKLNKLEMHLSEQ